MKSMLGGIQKLLIAGLFFTGSTLVSGEEWDQCFAGCRAEREDDCIDWFDTAPFVYLPYVCQVGYADTYIPGNCSCAPAVCSSIFNFYCSAA